MGRAAGAGEGLQQVASREPDPGERAAGKELLERVQGQLNAEEKQIAELRGQGHGWPEIAQQLGGTPDGRRMQLGRALDRVGRDLGLESGDD